MMTHAYQETYLKRAMSNMGNMFDYAINDFGLAAEDFVQMFLCSGISRRLEAGDPKYLVGMCGEETALRVIEQATGIVPEAEVGERWQRNSNHWCGWALCYYQWLRNIPYRQIFEFCSYDDLLSMYGTLHEADITKFADVMDKRRESQVRETRLRRIRTAYGCSQSELARMSGVSLRSIQMYEQRNKDINKGQLRSIASLAAALGCRIEDLMEA